MVSAVPGHPLALGHQTRVRLRAAVHVLLDLDGLDGAVDAVRLAVVVLASRTPSETGVVEIRTPELGRWLGLSASYTASVVVPALRRSGVVSVDVASGDFGQDIGLECRVLPLWAAQNVVGHPLALAKKEYATLLRLLEAVMAPGWAHRDGRVTPAGLLGTRTGRGAATDRLALLLLVLEARETGRVRQCGGTVDTKRGRAAATVARLLKCTVSAGERVLERLEDLELVLRVRLRTGSGMRNRSRLMVPAVAAAHGRTVAVDGQEDCAEALKAESSDPDVAAMPGESTGSGTELQVIGELVADGADVAEPDVAASLHADHPHLLAQVVDLSLSGGFSGEGRGGERRRPERACAGEGQASDARGSAAGPGSRVTEGGPLRGEKPKEFPVNERVDQRAAGGGANGWLKAVGGVKTQQQRVALPDDLRLRVALGPVSWLWQRLSRWQQDQVEAAVKAELAQLTGLGVLVEGAPRLLADRLTDRLAETGGEALVSKPFGWLIGRGLARRPSCTDPRCDDGIRLDTSTDCQNCGNVIHSRRAQRAQFAAQIDREFPSLADDKRRQLLENRMREQAAIEAADFVWRREQARAEKSRRDAGCAAAREQAEHERRAAAAVDAARQTLACEDCGRQQAGGLCEACGYGRRTECLMAEASLIAATWAADLDDHDDVAAVEASVRTALAADVERARREFLELVEPGELDGDPVATASALAFSALQAMEQAVPEFRSRALRRLGQTEEAEDEARRAYRTEQGRRWFQHNPRGADAVAAATRAAEAARERTARHLLGARLKQLRTTVLVPAEKPAAVPWAVRLPELAARPLDCDTAGTLPV
ncbi:hypothetical protein [Streptomyces griseus]|uniref:hypothetical protein n=1 Tax=Streptomyces griseus TaxID=1911 RepID=UPI00365C5FE8